MRILFDQGTPVPLRHHLTGHDVSTAFELVWSQLSNGELLRATAEKFDILITTDKNLRFQQNLSAQRLAVFVLPTTDWKTIQHHVASVQRALNDIQPGGLLEIKFSS